MYYIDFDDCTVVGTSENNYLQVRDGALIRNDQAGQSNAFAKVIAIL